MMHLPELIARFVAGWRSSQTGPLILVSALCLPGCVREDDRRIEAIKELGTHCSIPTEALLYAYQNYVAREKKFGRDANDKAKVIHLGPLSDHRLTDNITCVNRFVSKAGYRFDLHMVSPTALPLE